MEFPFFIIMKEFFTYEQLVEKLKADNLTITNEAELISILTHKGYYNLINGYASIFKRDKAFYSNITIEQILALYDFDQNLRSIVYKNTSIIECNIKALIAHEFSKVHGVDEKTYLHPSSFSTEPADKESIERLIETCNNTIIEAQNKHNNTYRRYLAYNKETYDIVPLWILIKTLTFGTASKFFRYMLPAERQAVANFFGVSAKELANILEIIVSFRNIVAHGERTYCARLPKARLSQLLPVVVKLSIPKNKKGENKHGRSDFLALLIACKYLLPPLDFSGMLTELELQLDQLQKKIPDFIFRKVKTEMGLYSDNWKKLTKF